jgi:hypothetical protein
MTIDRFTAWAMCPECESVDCHWLRLPEICDTSSPIDRALDQLQHMAWFNGGKRMPASMQSGYEVIRTCRNCENEWGMK